MLFDAYLNTILENITPEDFFDFYSLATAYNEPSLKYGNPDNTAEIERRLHYEANYIFNDQMNQLFGIVASRLSQEAPAMRRAWKLPLKPRSNDKLKDIDLDKIIHLTLNDRAKFLTELLAYRHKHNISSMVGGRGGVWETLGKQYIELTRTNINDINSLIMALDRIFGLHHHCGSLTDFFDEHWLEQALHIRSTASPAELLPYTSTDVRDLVSTAAHGVASGPISPNRLIEVAINRKINQRESITGEVTYNAKKDIVKLNITFTQTNLTINGWLQYRGNNIRINTNSKRLDIPVQSLDDMNQQAETILDVLSKIGSPPLFTLPPHMIRQRKEYLTLIDALRKELTSHDGSASSYRDEDCGWEGIKYRYTPHDTLIEGWIHIRYFPDHNTIGIHYYTSIDKTPKNFKSVKFNILKNEQPRITATKIREALDNIKIPFKHRLSEALHLNRVTQ